MKIINDRWQSKQNNNEEPWVQWGNDRRGSSNLPKERSEPINLSSSASQTLKDERDIEVSIIIPSFNKYPLNLFTLYSLELQTIHPSKMEVVFIDDASTDLTQHNIQHYNPPYHFKYIRNQKNHGRSAVRNLGIKAARGKILIFLDAEMITEPDFVVNHLKYHQGHDQIVATGVMHSKAVYTCVFPDFNARILKRIEDMSGHRVKENSKEPSPLITLSEIKSGAYKKMAVNTFSWFKTVINHYNEKLEGFEFPWMAFLTGNVSIQKQFIEAAGNFDEEFVKYGYEDWELGYRLSKIGAKFMVGRDIGAYHQEHPIRGSKWQEAVGNFGLFTVKHFDVDTMVLGLELSQLADLTTMNNILKEYKQLMKLESTEFEDFKERFMAILETINLFLHVDIRHFNLLGASGFGTEQTKALDEDIKSLKKRGKYTNLTTFLEKVMNSTSTAAAGGK